MKVKDWVFLGSFRRSQPAAVMPRNAIDLTLTIIATGVFSGYARIVPGTVGSLVGLVLFLPLAASPLLVRVVATAAVFLLGVFASSRMEEIWKIKDPNLVVIDEIVGMWIALVFVPYDVVNFVAAFLLFRLFDILKPFPAKQAELFRGGWGIMLDDVFAGIYACAAINGFHILRSSLA